jgi:hypothetical protein
MRLANCVGISQTVAFWQFQRAGILGEKLAPDLEHVAKQAQRDPGVFVVLMLEEDVEERGAAINRRAEEEVALGF